jgi:hypothetical protein
MSLRGYCVELGEQVDQLALLFPAEWLEELVIEGFDGGQDLCESREALRRDRHDVATPVLGITGSLRVADSLEQVDKLDHVAAVDSESATQVLLRWFVQSPQRHEDQKVERSELPASEYLLEASLGGSANAASRRRLLGFEPVFEGGWLHKGARARAWEVEQHLVAVALFGDVVVDLAGAKSLPAFVELHAYPVLRDVDVVVPEGMAVEVTGRWVADHVTCEVPDLPADRRANVLRVVSHTFRGDVNIRVAAPGASSSSPGGR